jgi:adenine phosphoribosyltransferase
MHQTEVAAGIRARIRDVADFPKAGIIFKDITPVLADATLLQGVITAMAEPFAGVGIETVAAIESRGFIFGAGVALALGAGLALIRKPGKLPHTTTRVDYQLEYGSDALEAHTDALAAGRRVLIVDDVLATGGTAAATVDLLQRLGGDVVGAMFLLELSFLGARQRLSQLPVRALVAY